MKKIVLPVLAIIILAVAGLWYFLKPQQQTKTALEVPSAPKEITPSETSIDYTDPSGFSFSYPDNLSITNKSSSETPDPNAYADLQIFSKDKSGSLSLKVTDTKVKSLEEWRQKNGILDTAVMTEKTLGQLKAQEIKTSDHLMLASLDQGILFTVEMPLIEQEFWSPVYEKVLTSFNFSQPETVAAANTSASEPEMLFEGEEVIE